MMFPPVWIVQVEGRGSPRRLWPANERPIPLCACPGTGPTLVSRRRSTGTFGPLGVFQPTRGPYTYDPRTTTARDLAPRLGLQALSFEPLGGRGDTSATASRRGPARWTSRHLSASRPSLSATTWCSGARTSFGRSVSAGTPGPTYCSRRKHSPRPTASWRCAPRSTGCAPFRRWSGRDTSAPTGAASRPGVGALPRGTAGIWPPYGRALSSNRVAGSRSG